MGPGTQGDGAQNTSRVSVEPNAVNKYNPKPTPLGANPKMPVDTTQHKPTDMTMTPNMDLKCGAESNSG